jgi:RNA polymerase sigma-70 factor (ECF subfamily)
MKRRMYSDETTHEGIAAKTPRNDSPVPEPAAADELAPLIAAMRGGDERALEQVYDATVGRLHALASTILRNVEDAEEIVCSTYAYAWANAARFEPERASALAWLLMLCRSRALDRLRQLRAGPPTVDFDAVREVEGDEDEQPDDLLSLFQQRSLVRAALEQLTPQRRLLISLSFLQGWSHHEIAAATGMPLGTVKSNARRALAQLRAALGTS